MSTVSQQTDAQAPTRRLSVSMYWNVLLIVLVALASFLIGALASKGMTSSPITSDPSNPEQVLSTIADAVNAANTSNFTDAAGRAHIYFLLDRSGSMASMATDVIGGFNAFVKEQQAEALDAARLLMTLIQFDSQDPNEVVFSGWDVADVPPLTSKTFQPRSATPLFDALGRMINMASANHAPDERIVVVTFSDGRENASREYSRKAIFDMIQAKREAGWAFVFLGANQDSYSEAGRLGYGTSNTQNFHPDKQGCGSAYSSMSGALSSMRKKLFTMSAKHPKPEGFKDYDSEDFFEGAKGAQEDYESRSFSKYR